MNLAELYSTYRGTACNAGTLDAGGRLGITSDAHKRGIALVSLKRKQKIWRLHRDGMTLRAIARIYKKSATFIAFSVGRYQQWLEHEDGVRRFRALYRREGYGYPVDPLEGIF